MKIIFVFGFIVGSITIFYALPYYEREFGVINRPSIDQLTDFQVPILLDTTDLEELEEQSLTKSVYLSIDLAKSAGLDKPASKHTLSVIGDIAKYNQDMRKHISHLLSGKDLINNADALIIFDTYLSGMKREKFSNWKQTNKS